MSEQTPTTGSTAQPDPSTSPDPSTTTGLEPGTGVPAGETPPAEASATAEYATRQPAPPTGRSPWLIGLVVAFVVFLLLLGVIGLLASR